MEERSEAYENLLKARREYLNYVGIPDYAALYVKVGSTSIEIALQGIDLEYAAQGTLPRGYEHAPDAPLAKLSARYETN